jgi:hypothetical protein
VQKPAFLDRGMGSVRLELLDHELLVSHKPPHLGEAQILIDCCPIGNEDITSHRCIRFTQIRGKQSWSETFIQTNRLTQTIIGSGFGVLNSLGVGFL